MPRASESVAALAAALAKAQAQLVNPEKSLIATIPPGRTGERERTFHYASLASGLDIVRKVLGQHAIATLQTTAIDAATGLINLTTTLAHDSGEWIASDWPVCPLAETANPQRMGAALTYARRYALFTLVGIAGEDDLDAPELTLDHRSVASPDPSSGERGSRSRFPLRGPTSAPGRRSPSDAGMLDAVGSAGTRDTLLAEIDALASAEQAATWTRAALVTKNRLTTADALLVEAAFARKLATIASPQMPNDPAGPAPAALRRGPDGRPAAPGSHRAAAEGRVDKSVLTFGEPRRYRNKAHLRLVAHQACLLCGRKPSDPHHLRFMQPRALGLKVSDEFTVPLCRLHHRALHSVGNERQWWASVGIDPAPAALRLWQQTRGTETLQPETACVSKGEAENAESAPATAASEPVAKASTPNR